MRVRSIRAPSWRNRASTRWRCGAPRTPSWTSSSGPWWRSAINTEAKLLFLGHAFEVLGANRVAIKTDIRNERSQAAIARLGAKREGVLRHQYVRPDGTLRDTVVFSILPHEWPAVRLDLTERLARG